MSNLLKTLQELTAAISERDDAAANHADAMDRLHQRDALVPYNTRVAQSKATGKIYAQAKTRFIVAYQDALAVLKQAAED